MTETRQTNLRLPVDVAEGIVWAAERQERSRAEFVADAVRPAIEAERLKPEPGDFHERVKELSEQMPVSLARRQALKEGLRP